jgi:hypothetical protein
MGDPGWPEFAACTASMQRVRIVLIASFSVGVRSLTTAGPVFMGTLPCAALRFLAYSADEISATF